jgi:hypothetical protein
MAQRPERPEFTPTFTRADVERLGQAIKLGDLALIRCRAEAMLSRFYNRPGCVDDATLEELERVASAPRLEDEEHVLQKLAPIDDLFIEEELAEEDVHNARQELERAEAELRTARAAVHSMMNDKKE